MTRYMKRVVRFGSKIFPDKPVTTKPAETRMGSGKGSLEYWVAVVKPGRVLFEVAGVPEEVAREALRLAMHKLPVKWQNRFQGRLRRLKAVITVKSNVYLKDLRAKSQAELNEELVSAKKETV